MDLDGEGTMDPLWGWILGWLRRVVGICRRVLFGRPGRRWGRAARIAALVVVLAYGGLLAFPGILLAHHVSHGPFEVWSDVPIDPAIGAVLDEAGRRLAASPLNDPAVRHRVFLCNTPFCRALLGPGRDGSFGVTYEFVGHSTINRSDVAADLVFRGAKKHDRRPLSAVIAHERMHALISCRYGVIGAHLLPTWKVEGYCDVVAGGSSMDPVEGLRLIREGKRDDPGPLRYFRYRLMVQYLLEVEGLDVETIMDREFDEDRVLADVRRSLDKLGP
jgi:hypothetical protein